MHLPERQSPPHIGIGARVDEQGPGAADYQPESQLEDRYRDRPTSASQRSYATSSPTACESSLGSISRSPPLDQHR